MTNRLEMNRRQFVVTTAAVGGGMALGVDLPMSGGGKALAAAGDVEFGALIVIGVDDTITIRAAGANVGNGVRTASALLVCEELNCDWAKVRTEGLTVTRNVDAGGVYSNMFGNARMFNKVESLPQAGASARERLKTAAAQQWNVPVAEIDAKDSKLTHRPTGRTLRYGEVAAKAATIKLDAEPKIKPMDQWTLIGKGQPTIEAKSIVNGSMKFAIDVRLPNMLHAVIKQSPVRGGSLKSFNADAIKDRPGVVKVIALGPHMDKSTAATADSALQHSVVVIAEQYWQAKTALDLLPVEWDDGPAGKTNTEDLRKQFIAKLQTPGKEGKKVGDAVGAMKNAVKVIEATYETGYIDHALMEVMNSTVLYTPDRVDIWSSAKSGITAQPVAAEQAGIDPKKVFVNSEELYLGGDFGRRGRSEDIRQSVAIAMQVPGRPVKLIWSREEQMRQGYYRPMAITKFTAGLGADGFPIAWITRHAGESLASLGPDFDYNLPNLLVEHHAEKTHIRIGAYRGPGHNQNPFAGESFMDEVALAGGKDPVELRRYLLRDVKDKGWLTSLNEVATKAQWGKPLPKGRAQGFAIFQRAETQVAEIAEVSVTPGGEIKVHTVDVAFDVGRVLNPGPFANQLEGGIMFGLNDTLYSEITIRNGRVVEGNFDDYPMLRIADAPQVRIHWGGLTGGNKVSPIGEQPNPPLPAAICNAIFRATGKRIRSLPLRNHDLSWA